MSEEVKEFSLSFSVKTTKELLVELLRLTQYLTETPIPLLEQLEIDESERMGKLVLTRHE